MNKGLIPKLLSFSEIRFRLDQEPVFQTDIHSIKLKFHIMKNKSLAIAAAILLSAGIAFSFVNAGSPCCDQAPQTCEAAASTDACCDIPCCDIPCCKK
jgi:hypothetical protein